MPPPEQLVYEAGTLEIDAGRRELRARGIPVPIGSRAFEIIEALAQSAGQLVSKDDLMARIWPGAVVGESTIQVHISAIRKALGPDRVMLQTTSGRGYRLLGRWRTKPREAPVDLVPTRTSAEPVPGNLPAAPAVLIGRNTALRHLRDLMSAYRIVTLTGPGGIGKTRLALETARTLAPIFGGAVWLVELGSLPDAGLVAAAVASVLGLQLGGSDVSPGALARAIDGRRLLLVIDNCEHVIVDAAGFVVAIVLLCPDVSVLATSREHMRIDGESAYRVPALDCPLRHPSEHAPSDVLESSAVQLFITRMAELRSDDQSQNDLSTIASICRRLDGIPLAIEFAAARAATLGVTEVLSRLDDRFALLTSGRRTALPKNRTLRATLDWSYGLLSEPERVLLRRLAIFAAAFSLEAATVVTGNDDAASPDIASDLANLVAKSLVSADNAGTVAQFRLLETTRAYALEKLASSGELQQFAERHGAWYRGRLETNGHALAARPIDLADLGNVQAALEWCFGTNGNTEIGIRLAAAAAHAFLAMSLLAECQQWSERALLAMSEDSQGSREEMHLRAALAISLMFTSSNRESAREALNRGLASAEEHAEGLIQLRLLSMLHLFYSRIGEFGTALKYASQASAVARTISDPGALAVAHCLVGLALHNTCDISGARVELEAALKIGENIPRISTSFLGFDNSSRACIALARTLWLQGQSAQALELTRGSVKAAIDLNHPVTLSIALSWAVSILLSTGELGDAEKHIGWFISHAQRHSLGPNVAVGGGFSGQLSILLGHAEDGVAKLQLCLVELHRRRYELLTTPFNISLIQGLTALGRFDEARALVEETIILIESRGDLCYMAEVLRVKANLLVLAPPGRRRQRGSLPGPVA